MLHLTIVFFICVIGCSNGYIWPQPQSFTHGSTDISLDSTRFIFQTTASSRILHQAFLRYRALFFPHPKPSTRGNTDDGVGLLLTKVIVQVATNTEYLQFDTDESYTLSIPSDGSSAIINSATVFGALHGLESMSQLIQYNFTLHQYLIHNTPWNITDFPRFHHRGLLIDTSRHFEPVSSLKRLIASLSYAKFNVMHWHLSDYQSFPLESLTFPNLWNGAYSDAERYTQDDVRDVVNFALLHGIRVVPEIDIPGHAGSWCVGYPSVCPDPSCNSPLDPSSDLTWEVLKGLLSELTGSQQYDGLFPENFVHLGGDEVNTDCWNSVPHVKQWLKTQNMTVLEAYMYFVETAHTYVIPVGRNPVNWEEVYLNFGTNLDKKSIVHTWLYLETIANATSHGYQVINSVGWYLDNLGQSWESFYGLDPRNGIVDPNQAKLVIGGEACMWGETVDTSDLFNTVWPRAAAISERLWSAQNVTDANAALPRLESFRCLLNRRGINAAPTLNSQARSAPPAPGGCYVQ